MDTDSLTEEPTFTAIYANMVQGDDKSGTEMDRAIEANTERAISYGILLDRSASSPWASPFTGGPTAVFWCTT